MEHVYGSVDPVMDTGRGVARQVLDFSAGILEITGRTHDSGRQLKISCIDSPVPHLSAPPSEEAGLHSLEPHIFLDNSFPCC